MHRSKDKLVLDEFLPYRLSLTSNLVSGTIASIYEALFALRIPEWRVVAVVAENDGITQQEIGVRTRMDKVTVSRAAIALGNRGIIERRSNKGDRRSRLLALTQRGHDLYRHVAPKALELEHQIFGGFTQAELALFRTTLHRIDEVALELLASGVCSGLPPTISALTGAPT